jgi:hypothetical protein
VRKLFITVLVGACLGVTGMLAMPGAKANSSCGTGPAASPSGTGGTLTVGTPAGCLTANGDAGTQSGYVVADGVATNPGPGGGYIGLDDSDGGPTIVGCASGEYHAGGGTQYDPAPVPPAPDNRNHVVASQAHPPGAPDPADPCTPSQPSAP